MQINDIIANPGAERVILSNCMNNQNLIIECESQGVLPKHFNIEANKIIYNAIVFMFANNIKIDALSILNIIKDKKAKQILEDIGGLEYILLLQQSPPTSNISMFCKELINNNVKKQLYDTCESIKEEIISSKSDSDTILHSITKQITDITLLNSNIQDAYTMGSSIEQRIVEAQQNKGKIMGIPTGWHKFDQITNGAEPGDLIVIVAESKTGKSVTMMNWAKYMAVNKKLPILWIDSEQSAEEEEWRLISIISQVPENEIKTGLFTSDSVYGTGENKTKAVNSAIKIMKDIKLFHVFMPDFTLEKIQATVRKFHLKEDIRAVFFDYINFNPLLLSMNKHLRDDMILTDLATGLKTIAGVLKIPIITAAQENRTGYGGVEKDAKNIGGSIGILQKASKLCFLRNKTEQELAIELGNKGNQKLLIKYQRHGQGDEELDILYNRHCITQIEI